MKRTLTQIVKDAATGTALVAAATGLGYVNYELLQHADWFVKQYGPQGSALACGGPSMALTIVSTALTLSGIQAFRGRYD